MAVLCGIDIGTTGVRASTFRADGSRILDRHTASTFQTPRAGWAEADADGFFRDAAACLEGAAEVDAVCVVGQAPTAILLGPDGAPLRPAILWLDTRAEEEAAEMASAFTDNAAHAYFLGPKLRWIEKHEPAVFARAWKVAQSHAYVAYRLTGELRMDPSTAALCAPLRSSPLFPEIAPAASLLGHVTAEAARITGLRQGTPVMVGGGDFAASALGAGVVEEGQACLMLGTAGNLLLPRKAPGTDARMINSHHVGADRFLSLGGTLCGAVLEWTRKMLGGAAHEVLEREAKRAGDLIMLPYLQGERTPIWDASARGVFFGLSLAHERGHLYRAAMEAIAVSFLHIAEVSGIALREVIAANGAGKSALFRQILADALGAPLTYVASGGTVGGAAILAGMGIGVQLRGMTSDPVVHSPDEAEHDRYVRMLSRRMDLYERVRSLHLHEGSSV